MKLQTKKPDLPHHYRQVKKLVTSRTARNSLIMLIGTGVSAFFSIVTLIVVSRKLGPEQFGVLATFNAIWMTILTLTDFGLGTSAVKFIASFLGHDDIKAAKYMRVIFQLELLCGVAIGIFGLVFSVPIANLIGGQQLLWPVRMGFLAGMFISAGAFMGPFLIAFEQFVKLSIVNIAGAAFRLVGVGLLISLTVLNLHNTIILYTIVPIFLFILALLVTPKAYIINVSAKEQRKILGKIIHFTKWIFLSTIATIAFGKLDVLLLSSLKGSTDVGLYSAAIQLTNFFPLIIGAVSSAILPRVSKYTTRAEFVRYFKKVVTGAVLVALALVPIYFVSGQLITAVFGSKYSGSIGAFKIIYPGYLLAFVTTPMALVFYAVNKPKTITAINYIQLVFLIIIDFIFIPRIGIYGAALGFLVSQIIGSLLTFVLSTRTIARQPE